MHKQFKIKCKVPNPKLTYNVCALVGNMILRKISDIDPKLGKWLHDKGAEYGNKHKAKLFIARLRAIQSSFKKGYIQVEGDELLLDVRFFQPELEKAFNKAVLLDESFVLADEFGVKELSIVGEKRMKAPQFETTMQYTLRTPSSLSEKKKEDKKGVVLKPNSPFYVEKLQNHFLRRTDILYHFGVADEGLEEGIEDLRFKVLGNRMKEKTIYFTPSSSTKAVGMKGYEFNFELTAPTIIHRMIYYGGFLENTARGFGYLDVLKSKQ